MSRNTDWNVPAKTSCLGWLEVWKYRKVSPQFNTGSIRNVNKHISKTRFRQRRKITNFAGKHAQLRESSRRKSSKFPRPKFLGLKFVNIISAWHPIDNKYCGILRGVQNFVFFQSGEFGVIFWHFGGVECLPCSRETNTHYGGDFDAIESGAWMTSPNLARFSKWNEDVIHSQF